VVSYRKLRQLPAIMSPHHAKKVAHPLLVACLSQIEPPNPNLGVRGEDMPGLFPLKRV
jgi:hypothetical protein